MQKRNYLPRLIDTTVTDYLSAFGAVVIEGPKWCGKTWTSAQHCNSEFFLGDPDGNFQNKHLAEMSPHTVLTGSTPRLLDEWQEVPPLWDAVRAEIDVRNAKGQFILTGSATPNRKGILHSGAGRIGRLRMRPMSLFEAGFSSGSISLKDLCRGELSPTITGEVELLKLAQYIVRGGWPGNLTVPEKQAGLMAAEYINAILENDVYRLDGVKLNVHKMRLLLKSLARNESTTATNKTLKNDIKAVDAEDVDDDTISTYLDVFRRLFLLDNQPPFAPGARSSIRTKQAEKRHLADPSLACALLKLSPAGLIQDLETFGFLFEALCERDLRIYANCFDGELYHYRDYRDNEIDAVIELPDKSWCALEIKLGANQIDKAAENLLTVNEKIKQADGVPASTLIVVCGLANAAYQRSDGIFVVPITALKN